MMKESDIDPITRELIDFALARRIWTMCWHISHAPDGVINATGYTTVSLDDKVKAQARQQWADALGLRSDQRGGFVGTYAGDSGLFRLHLPDAIDPDEHCRSCQLPFDPRDLRPDGRKRYGHGDVCRSCVTRDAPDAPPDGGPVIRETPAG